MQPVQIIPASPSDDTDNDALAARYSSTAVPTVENRTLDWSHAQQQRSSSAAAPQQPSVRPSQQLAEHAGAPSKTKPPRAVKQMKLDAFPSSPPDAPRGGSANFTGFGRPPSQGVGSFGQGFTNMQSSSRAPEQPRTNALFEQAEAARFVEASTVPVILPCNSQHCLIGYMVLLS